MADLNGLPDVIAAVQKLQADVAALGATRPVLKHDLAAVTQPRQMGAKVGRAWVYHCTCGRSFAASQDGPARLAWEGHQT